MSEASTTARDWGSEVCAGHAELKQEDTMVESSCAIVRDKPKHGHGRFMSRERGGEV